MEFQKKSQRTRCTSCLRHIRDAKQYQISINTPCETNLCKFTTEIREALIQSPPQIISFYSDKSETRKGEEIRLFWNVINIRGVSIDGLGNFQNKGNITVIINKSEKFKLKIIDFFGNIYEEVISVKVFQKPIISLKASQYILLKNEVSIITWSISNAISASIEINGRAKQINLRGEINLSVSRNTTIRVVSIGKDNLQAEKEIQISVLPPTIIQLKANYYITINSQPVRLSWNGRNYNSLYLIPENVDVINRNYIDVYPSEKTTYQLVAKNEVSQSTSTIVIDVMPLPSIQKLIIPKIEIKLQQYISTDKNVFLLVLEQKIRLLEFLSKHKIAKNPARGISLFSKLNKFRDIFKIKDITSFLRGKI